MEIPHRVRIKPKISYEIKYVDRFDNPEYRALCVRDVKKGIREILILKDLNKEDTIQSLIHEVMHCFEFEYHLKFPHPLIYSLETAIFSFLKLNGWI